ncbi:MAG: cation:proton antiporter [Deltaproteobacteria bacterium]|nr:MAG: cation:proton antiporter [Deltaproteobacteria bacterium]
MAGNFQLALHLFLQLTVILLACRIVGPLLRPMGQTQVVGEMVAGVLLGPSLLGMLAPEWQTWLFPGGAQMSILYALSQIGLVLYMFLIGMELNRDLLLQHRRDAALISLSGILPPVIVGGALGWFISDNPAVFTDRIAPWQAALFIASAVSITAFPMLARIVRESGIAKTTIGTLTLAAASVNDAAAWAFLACVIATVKANAMIAVLAIGGGLAYTLAMIFIAQPAFRLFAIFGAFVCGAVMPRGRFQREVVDRLEPLTVSLLLPTFFVYSGLNTRMNLVVAPGLLEATVMTLIVAFACKGGGCMMATRVAGASWGESAAVGALMNARGLMELILVNIALEKELITYGLFAILVLMAIVTTMLASPLYNWLHRSGLAVPTPEHAKEAA